MEKVKSIEPEVYNLPLKIIHTFPYGKTADDKSFEWVQKEKAKCSFSEKQKVITEKLIEFKEKGFGGIVSNSPFDEYLTEEGLKIFNFIADECERLNLRLWIYDENGYPSGSCGGKTLKDYPDYECRAVVMVNTEMEPNSTCEMSLPKGHENFLSCAVYLSDNGVSGIQDFTPVYTADCFNEKEKITLKNPTDKKAVACAFVKKRLYEGTHAEHNVCASRRYIDLTYDKAVRAFIDNTYEVYAKNVSKRFNNKKSCEIPKTGLIEATFTDECSLMGCYINSGIYPQKVQDQYDDTITLYPLINWSHDFESEFENMKGYSVLPELIYMFTGKTERAKKVRRDYHEVISSLLERAFFAQIGDWCKEHKTNFSGHVLLEDDIRWHSIFEGNFFSLLRHMQVVGIDMLHGLPDWIYDRFAFTPKLASSVAKFYGRKHVMCEASMHTQVALNMPVSIPEQYASIAVQYAFGVDLFTYYFTETFMEKDEYFKRNTAHGRIDKVMKGKTLSNVLMYYPIETMQMNHVGSDKQLGEYGEEENACQSSLTSVQAELLNSQIDFDYIDFELLSKCKVVKNKLITPKGYEYDYFILPACERTEELNSLVKGFAEKGLKVYSQTSPLFKTLDGVKYFDDAISLVKSIDRKDFYISFSKTEGRLATLTRKTKNGMAYLFVNADKEEKAVKVNLYGLKNPVLYSPLENKELNAEFKRTGKYFEVEFKISGDDALIVKEK